jgi:hypothetical protein
MTPWTLCKDQESALLLRTSEWLAWSKGWHGVTRQRVTMHDAPKIMKQFETTKE